MKYRDPAGRMRSQSFDRKSDAKAFKASVETDLRRGRWTDPVLGSVPFRDYATQWLQTKANLRPRTFVNVEGRVRNHILPVFGGYRMGDIRPNHVRAWVAGLTASGLAPETVRAIYRTFGQIIQTAEIDGLVARSPLVGAKQSLPASCGPQEEMCFLSHAQVAELAETISPRFRVPIYAAAYLGVRDGELWAMRGSTLNMLKGTVQIDRSLYEVRKGLPLPPNFVRVRPGLVLGPTKTGRPRSLHLPGFLTELLAGHLRAYPPGEEGFVFTSPEGQPVRHHNFYKRHFIPAVRRASGLPGKLRFHDLRHTCAALCIDAGWDLEDLKEYLGHSSIRVTSDRYGHRFPKHREALRDRLDRAFREAPQSAEPGVVVAPLWPQEGPGATG
ncbi:MAG: tyrosine-type recombinase/integrase [Actinomycetota bacterium]